MRILLQRPNARAAGRNTEYVRMMLSNMGGAESEMSAVSLYFYSHLVTQETPEVAAAFRTVGMAEMRHLEIFGKLALQLGGDPRLWEYRRRRPRYWSPGYNRYPTKLRQVLSGALYGEYIAIDKYSRQLKIVADDNVAENLRRIIEEEREHASIFKKLLQQYG